MLDRLISGAGAVTDLADRAARIFSRRGTGDLLGRRPGSVIIAGLLAALAVILLLVGLEATDNPTPRTLSATEVATTDDVGSRTYASISGAISPTYVETYVDENDNHAKDPDERSEAWWYFLVDPATRSGVAVRSTRVPDDVFRIEVSGTVVKDATYVAEDRDLFADEVAELGLTLDPDTVIDATVAPAAPPTAITVGSDLPGDGEPVTIGGIRGSSWTCTLDPDSNGICDSGEDGGPYDLIVYDPATRRGVIVVLEASPEFSPASFTGMLRRDERSASQAKTVDDLDFDSLGLTVSDRYILDADAAPTSATLAFAFAALCGAIAGTILIGLAGGYLIYRRASGALPAPASTLAVGERIPLRVTGVLRVAGGEVHVREAPADLLRFQTVEPVVAAASVEPAAEPSTAVEVEPAAPVELPTPVEPTPVEPTPVEPPPVEPPTPVAEPPSTLIVERQSRAEGVAVGLGELRSLTVGRVLPLRGSRPAIRAVAGTGPLLLSFDDAATRDRAAAELLDETGLAAPGPAPAGDA